MTFDEAIREIREFCTRVEWQCRDVSENYSGVVLSTQAQADGDPGTEEPDKEPWPPMPEGQYSLRGRVSRLHPPGLIEETARGVIVIPPDTESVRLVFDRGGRLVRYMDLPAEVVINAMPAFPNFVKTSGAPASHAAICLLLRMLQQKFMTNLQVDDDTGFWETGSIDLLERKHAEMIAILGVFRESKDVGALLRALGIEVPTGGKIEQLVPQCEMPSAARQKKKTTLN
jgi:hypothetical protein